jgi:hypothetical protein
MALMVFGLFLRPPGLVWAAKPYKIYVINKYGAWDIVCDAYTVKKEDHIWDILRRKGRIAEEDFPRFVEILKKMNPGIQDVNKIYPNQKILIPLKQLPAKDERRPTPGPRYVTIPMLPDVLYRSHKVETGECLSKIVAHQLGLNWNEVPKDYLDTLKRLNPRIKDLDLIYAGETIRLPELKPVSLAAEESDGVQTVPTDLVETAGADTPLLTPGTGEEEPMVAQQESAHGKDTIFPKEATPEKAPSLASSPQKDRDHGEGTVLEGFAASGDAPTDTFSRKRVYRSSVDVVFPLNGAEKARWHDGVSQVLTQVGGRLLTSGHIIFPAKKGRDVALNLAAFPVAEWGSGKHVLLASGRFLPEDIEKVIRASWPNLLVLRADPGESAPAVLENILTAFLGAKTYRELVLPPFDDGVQVTLRADWIMPREKGGENQYQAISVLGHPGERTSPAITKYLNHHGIVVTDIVEETPGEKYVMHASGKEKAKVALLSPAIDGTGQEAFVSTMAHALGFFYAPNTPIVFNYAGFQVQTSANLIYGKSSLDVVVDFGTFYGDAKSAIEGGGMRILTVKPEDDLLGIARGFFDMLRLSYVETPMLLAANRSVSTSIGLSLPGVLVSHGEKDRAFLTFRAPEPELLAFLNHHHIEALVVDTGKNAFLEDKKNG